MSDIQVTGVTDSSATFSWRTDELSDSQVEFGPDTTYGTTSALDSQLVISHRQTVTGLLAAKTYHFRVISRDSEGNAGISADHQFVTQAASDSNRLKITDVSVAHLSQVSVLIEWVTNGVSTSRVEYGFDTTYGFTTENDTNRVVHHGIVLSGLQSDTTYHFRAISGDGQSTSAVGQDSTFKTTTAARISTIAVRNISTASATITWVTDQAADTQIDYGLTREYGSTSPLEAQLGTEHSVDLAGLTDNQTYHFRVMSRNSGGTLAISNDSTFSTRLLGAPPTNNPPRVTVAVAGKSLVDNKITVQPGELVQFRASKSFDADGDSLRFRWFFGDGQTSQETNPAHVYDKEGTYSVTLQVDDEKWPQYDSNPFVIPIPQPSIGDRGGIIVADLDGDGLLDYLVSTKDGPLSSQTSRATIGAYSHYGTPLWVEDVDLRINEVTYGLPGLFGPGLAAGDIDDDGQVEVLHLDTGHSLIIRNGRTGVVERTLALPTPQGGIGRWGQIQIVNLRGKGDKDLILQADHDPNNFDVKNPFPWIAAIALDTGKLLWSRNDYYGVRHGGFRAVDIDNDGLDEVAGGVFVDDDGSRMNTWNYRHIRGHLDAISIADIKPEVRGLEAVLLEESHRQSDRVAFVNPDQVFIYASRNGDEPQNTAIGDFDLTRPGLEVWCRSRFNVDQSPWVFDASGTVIAQWKTNETKPFDWSIEGIETIFTLDWDGGPRPLLAAKERHADGKVAIVDPMTGEFVRWWPEQAGRIFVADVSGDYREEIVVLNNPQHELHIYWNEAANLNPAKARKWHLNHYQRQKQNYNYYSP
ncbi:MAG: PKD domain-containing protein [bacterium]